MSSESNSCIGHLESSLHHVFASVRVPGEEYVYCPPSDLYGNIDEYCDEQHISEPRPPLLILGEIGSGKSALVANWFHRRSKSQARSRNEYVFFHAIGCTRHSTKVTYLMRRLMTFLKKKFELTRDVTSTNDRLSWDLPRFLDLASKRGKIVIIIDGVSRLENDDGTDAGMMWLPLEFPPNVRVILTAAAPLSLEFTGNGTASGDNDSSPRKPRFITELERRQMQVIRIKPLERALGRSIIDSYIRKTVQASSSKHLSTPFLTETAGDDGGNERKSSSGGFMLFDTQLAEIVSHLQAANPMFLSYFLRCMNWAVSRGYSLWQLQDEWLAADNCNELLHKILTRFECGYQSTTQMKDSDCDRSLKAGGIPGLRMLYPWHPLFQEIEEVDDAEQNDWENDDYMIDFQQPETIKKELSSAEIITTNKQEESNKQGERGALSNSVLQSLGDQQWLGTSEAAEAKLESIRLHSGRHVAETIAMAARTSQQTSFMDVLVANMMSLRQKTELRPRAVSATLGENDEALIAAMKEAEEDDEEGFDDLEEADGEGEGSDPNAVDEGLGGGSVGSDGLMGAASIPASPKFSKNVSFVDASQPSAVASTKNNAPDASNLSGVDEQFTKNEAADNDNDSVDSNTLNSVNNQAADPSEHFEYLPEYACGGTDNEGFGSLLGHALALLYVARHGLRENELWSMLVSIKEIDSSSSVKTNNSLNDESRALIAIFYRYRGQLEDVWRTIDTFHNGLLTKKQLLSGMKKVNPEFNMFDLRKVLESVSMLDEDPSSTKIEYKTLQSRIATMDKKIKSFENRVRVSSKQHASASAVEEFDDYTVDGRGIEQEEGGLNQPNSCVSLGPVMEESLLSVLCALGVLHSTEHQILVLPVENTTLRQVIYEKYVCDRAGELAWHVRIIHYFQRQYNSLRRCEELPWHLQICRKWYSLKDTLTDLVSFEMMFNGELRGELMNYWLVLTEGPLFISDEAQKEGISKQMMSDATNMLSELDIAAAKGLSEKEAKKQLLKNQVATFDVVMEFNRSIESWTSFVHPSTVKLCRILMQIACFLAEFSLKGEAPPPFLRLLVEKKALEAFGVYQDEITKGILADGGGSNSHMDATITAGEAGVGSPTNSGNDKDKEKLEQLETQLYHFKRWIWIQFPWMALEHAAEMATKASYRLKSVHGRHKKSTKRLEGSTGSSSTAGGDYEFEIAEFYDSGKRNRSTDGSVDVKGHMNEHMRRFWGVKKHDPSHSLFSSTASRKSAQIRSSLTNSHSLSALESSLKDVSETNHIISLGRCTSKYHKPLDDAMALNRNIPHATPSTRSLKSNTRFPTIKLQLTEKHKTMEQDEDLYYKANNTLRLGGTVELPSEGDLEREIQQVLKDERLAQMNARMGLAIPLKSEEEVEYHDELDRLGKLRQLSDKVHEVCKTREKTLQSLKEQMEARDRLDQATAADLTSGEISICAMEERHSTLSNALEEGKCHNQSYSKLIEVMSQYPPFTERHIAALEQEVALARQQLVDLCNSRRNMYLESEKMQKKKMEQLHDKILYYQTIRKNLLRKFNSIFMSCPELRLQYTNLESGRSFSTGVESSLHGSLADGGSLDGSIEPVKLSSNVVKVAQALSRNVAMTSNNFVNPNTKPDVSNKPQYVVVDYSRQESISNMPLTNANGENSSPSISHKSVTESSVSSSKSPRALKPVATAKTAQHTHQSEMESKKLMEYLQDKTHSSSAEEFIEKFTSNIQLTDSLRTHQNVCESKIAQLRAEHAELYDSWGATVFEKGGELNGEGNGGSAIDARYLDQKLFQAEMKLNSSARKSEKSLLLINEIRTGVNHVVTLLAANAKLLSNLPKSVPPALNTDEDIAQVLSWCEERVLAIQEALVLDTSSSHAVANDNQPLHARQIELSSLIHDMNQKMIIKAKKKKKAVREKRSGGISLGIINDTVEDVMTPRAIMVPSKSAADKDYDKKVKNSIENHDKNEANFEEKVKQELLSRGNPAKDVAKFLNDSLSTHDSKEMLRRSNFLSNKKQGRRAGYGYALEGVLRSTLHSDLSEDNQGGENFDHHHAHHSPLKNNDKEVLDREEYKARSLKERNKHERKQPRKKDLDGVGSNDDESAAGKDEKKHE